MKGIVLAKCYTNINFITVNNVLEDSTELFGVIQWSKDNEKNRSALFFERILKDMLYNSGFSIKYYRDSLW